MRNILRDYLTFTNKERNGLLVLISILVLVLIYLKLDLVSEPVDNTDMAEFASEMEALAEPGNTGNDGSSDSPLESIGNKKTPSAPYVFHEFDPNYVTDDEWREMGLKTWQIKGIRNYREKAGDIRSAEQFEKLHVVTDEFFETVKGHLVFEEKHEKLSKTDSKDKVKGEEPEAILSIELNSASAGQLMDLKGIGPAFSNRIVKYRNWLGGFIRLDQLREVYGLKDSLYA
ncbi:MAG: helix-hairpin-helix domain-containing protein, partial [Flavobacteriales bacterium]|nr:helix-hairpin-helix domain-containing protein [Flavobacteriales bacterium]